MILCDHNTIFGRMATDNITVSLKVYELKNKSIQPADIMGIASRDLYFYNLEAIITVYTFKLAHHLHFTDEETNIHR